MAKVSLYLRSTCEADGVSSGFCHWCPGCETMHYIRVHGVDPKWTFNNDAVKSTFGPSVRISGKQCVYDAQGKWTGLWVLDDHGRAKDFICHYFLIDGELRFCGDSTHKLAAQSIKLPPLPGYLEI